MIKPAALLMAVVMAAVTAGTYFGLDFLPQGLLPPPIGRIPKTEPAPPKVEVAPLPPVASAAPQNAPAPEAAPAAQPVTEQDLAEEPPPKAAPAPAPAPAPAETKPEPAAAAAAAPAPKPEPAIKPEPPAPTPAPAAKPKPAPKPQPGQPASVASAESPTAAPAKAKPPEADVIKPWWPDASKMPANQLKLMYAGQVKGEEAVALLFSAPLSLDTVKQHAQIKAEGGSTVSGDWELGKNPRLAVFRGLKPGRYTVILQPEIADEKGFMLGATLKGPVYVQPPETQ